MVVTINSEIEIAKKEVKKILEGWDLKEELLLPLARIYIKGKQDGLELARTIFNQK